MKYRELGAEELATWKENNNRSRTGQWTTICVVAAPPAICVRRLRLPLLGKRYWNM